MNVYTRPVKKVFNWSSFVFFIQAAYSMTLSFHDQRAVDNKTQQAFCARAKASMGFHAEVSSQYKIVYAQPARPDWMHTYMPANDRDPGISFGYWTSPYLSIDPDGQVMREEFRDEALFQQARELGIEGLMKHYEGELRSDVIDALRTAPRIKGFERQLLIVDQEGEVAAYLEVIFEPGSQPFSAIGVTQKLGVKPNRFLGMKVPFVDRRIPKPYEHDWENNFQLWGFSIQRLYIKPELPLLDRNYL